MTKGKTLTVKKSAAKTATKQDNVKGNVDKTKKRITEAKDLKYIYPKEINELTSRKKFRGNARSKRDSFMKKIAKAENPSAAKKLRAEANAWAKEIFTKSGMPTF